MRIRNQASQAFQYLAHLLSAEANIIVPLVAAILSMAFIYAGERRPADLTQYRERYAFTAKHAAAHPIVAEAQVIYTSVSDLGEVESIARDYIEGWYTGDVARMDRALHDDLVKRMPVHEGSSDTTRLLPVSKARMLELTTEGGGDDPDAVFEIIIDDISRDIATARVTSPEYLDYLQLAKTSRGWKIVNVLFHTRD